MSERLNYYIVFQSDFERPVSVFEPAGQELANILVAAFAEAGAGSIRVEPDNISQHVTVEYRGVETTIWIGLEEIESDRWFILPDKKCRKEVDGVEVWLPLAQAIDETLRKCHEVSDVRWYPYFDDINTLDLIGASPGPFRDPAGDNNVHPLVRADRLFFSIWQLALFGLGIGSVILTQVWPEMIDGRLLGTVWLLVFASGFVVPIVLSRAIARASEAKRSRAHDGPSP